MLPGMFIGYVLNSGGGWTGDMIIADWHDIEDFVASEYHVNRFKSKKVGIKKLQDVSSKINALETRRSRTTSNCSPPKSRMLRRGEEYLRHWARRGVTLCSTQRSDSLQEEGGVANVSDAGRDPGQTKTNLEESIIE